MKAVPESAQPFVMHLKTAAKRRRESEGSALPNLGRSE